MFNIYQFEKKAKNAEQKQSSKQSTTTTASDKQSKQEARRKSDQQRERMIANYKGRVTSFIKDMTTKPVKETDFYGKGFEQQSHAQRMLGPPKMAFGAVRSDDERVETAAEKNLVFDSVPTDPEWTIWKMRPREKNKEIGPSMRFNSHFQAERLMESLKNRTQAFFTKESVTGDGKDSQHLEKKVKAYNKTGKYNHVGASSTFGSETSLAQQTRMVASIRSGSPAAISQIRPSRLQRSNYFLEPREMMSNIHQKTHFKAAISISRGDACCVKVEKNEFGDQYAEIARNIDVLNRSAKEMKKGGQVSNWLKRKRNCQSQGKQQRRFKAQNQSVIEFNGTTIDGNSQQESIIPLDGPLKGRAASVPGKNEVVIQDWTKMTDEERQAFQMLNAQEISPSQVTNQVLKLCNIVRQSLDTRPDGKYMKKRSGIGGTGGRELSPDLRTRYGTFGFKKQVASKGRHYLDDRVTSANTINIMHSGRNHSSYITRRQDGGAGGFQDVQDTMATNESTQAPPVMRSSVDMGMGEDLNRLSFQDSGEGSSYNRLKKRVVLRRPGQQRQGGAYNRGGLVKSLTNMPANFNQSASLDMDNTY